MAGASDDPAPDEVVKKSAANRLLPHGVYVGGALVLTHTALQWRRHPLEWHKPPTTPYRVERTWLSTVSVRARRTALHRLLGRWLASADLLVATADGDQEVFTVMDPEGWRSALAAVIAGGAQRP